MVGILGISRDVTSAKEVERRLRLMQFSIDRAVDSIFLIGPTGEIVYVNDAVTKALWYAREEIIGMFVPEIDPNFTAEDWSADW